ncbi:hypothetical protein LguiB_021244 [Lonicera macranthoides]
MYSWLHPTNNWYYSDCDIRPILLSTYKNTTSSFVFGFVYNRSANAIKDGFCFFLVIALLPGDNVNDLVVLWSANRDNPVRENATLHFTADSGLELKDVDGTLVWSTNTSAVPVTRLNISDGANLMLLDSKDKVIWQSFDYPTDTWLPNQSISPNKGLTSSNSSSNLGITVLFKSKSNNNSVAFIKVQKQASKDKRKLSLVTVLVSTLSVGLVIILLVVSCYYYNMRIKWNKEEEEEEGDDQVDIFSFGIVILEIVFGRKNLDSTQSCPLINVVKEKAENDQLHDLVDGYLEDIQFQKEEAVKMIKIGIWCLQAHNTRPSISTVLKVLEGSMDLGPVSEFCFATTLPTESHLRANSAQMSTPPAASILSGPR